MTKRKTFFKASYLLYIGKKCTHSLQIRDSTKTFSISQPMVYFVINNSKDKKSLVRKNNKREENKGKKRGSKPDCCCSHHHPPPNTPPSHTPWNRAASAGEEASGRARRRFHWTGSTPTRRRYRTAQIACCGLLGAAPIHRRLPPPRALRLLVRPREHRPQTTPSAAMLRAKRARAFLYKSERYANATA